MPDETIAAEIAELETLLNAGVSNVSSDGESLTFNPDDLRRRIETLKSQLSGKAHKARVVRNIDLSGSF